MPQPPRLSLATCVAVTVDLEDFHSLAARRLAITLTARKALTDLEVDGGLAYRLTPGATPAEVNAELATLLRGVLADILGPRGLYVDVDIDAGTGEVFMTPLGSIPQRAATIRIASIDESEVAAA